MTERMITKTLADIYLQQGHAEEAFEILETLHERDPSDREVEEKLKELSRKYGFSLLPAEERIRILQGWLDRIKERKGEK
jgi:hypothetical protein